MAKIPFLPIRIPSLSCLFSLHLTIPQLLSLRNFKEIKHLRIELPGGELGIEDGVLLKWKAEFGTTLESCVILGASSLAKKEKKSNLSLNNSEAESVVDGENLVSVEDGNGNGNGNNGNGSGGGIPEPFYTK